MAGGMGLSQQIGAACNLCCSAALVNCREIGGQSKRFVAVQQTLESSLNVWNTHRRCPAAAR
jgi:hypothetical protein